MTAPDDLQARRDELQKRRAERRAELERARAEQELRDDEALDAVEEEHGVHRLVRMKVATFQPGHPATIAFRLPTPDETERFRAQGNGVNGKPGNQVKALQVLARTCVVHPSREGFDALVKVVPGVDTAAGKRLAEAIVAEEEREGKS